MGLEHFPRAEPHGHLEVFPDVFVVRGTLTMMPLMSVARNMTVVRDGKELTVVNSVRLSDEGEKELAALGVVRHVVRLGMGHGVDDPYYIARYAPQLWGAPGAKHQRGIRATRELTDEAAGPVAGSRAFVFQGGTEPEAALVLERSGGILVTCDSLQNHVDFEGSSAVASMALTMMGFKGPARIGPPWRSRMERGGRSLADDFRRIAALPFRHLLSAHGARLRDRAPDAVRATVEKAFPPSATSRAP